MPLDRRMLFLIHTSLLLVLLLSPNTVFADSVNSKERTVTKLAENIYVIRHKDAPDGFPQGNTTVIIGDLEVLVVDSCYLPSSAREDIAQIRQWTNKPVRYLVNTHWHYDHTMGNGTYAEAFPQLGIIAHTETRKQMEGYNPRWFEKYPQRATTFKQRLDSGKNLDGSPLTEIQRKDFATALEGVAPVSAEFKTIVDRLPTLTFDRELQVDVGNRVVQIKHLGRGNTAGDTIVYLPAEKILIAGDLLDYPVPYLGGGYPSELIKTLERLGELEEQTIVPGHGEVLSGGRGEAHRRLVIEFLQTIVSQVSREIYRIGNGPRNLEPVREAVLKTIDLASWRERFGGGDKDNVDFFNTFSLPGVITAAYAELWGR
ncbi:MAG TPA: MBL fold metallo-hydrolase [Pyrinomonadaceae bacterium]|nr:MBL fold metallo-hydrolase [Pyrinomonadaceae bacterium]